MFEVEEESYYFPCWGCEIPVRSLVKTPKLRVFCPDCKEDYLSEKEDTLKQYILLKMKVMHERALRFLEKQLCCLADYKDASEVVLEFALGDPEKFGSSHEMMAAMELIRHEIKIKLQQKVGKHRVDILIPSMKAVLEIDGYMHQHSQVKDSKRDVEVQNELGVGWEVIRIPTKHIEKNVGRLIPAIKEMHNYKQQLRVKHNGFLPTGFSEREKQHHLKILKGS